MNTLETALFYHEVLGLNVIPLIVKPNTDPTKTKTKKQPLVDWIPYQDKKVTREEIEQWWGKQYPNAGIAAVVGSISGGVVVIDCDSPQTIVNMEAVIPDDKFIPIAETATGGRHYYFTSEEKMQKCVGFLPQMDFQAEYSLIVMPPTPGINGSSYNWVAKPENPQDFPSINIIDNKLNNTIYRACMENCKENGLHNLQGLTRLTSSNIFEYGVRDDNLYHIAHNLLKSGNTEEYVKQVLRAIVMSWGETDEKWISDKVKSSLKRQDRSYSELKRQIEGWVYLQIGYYSITECLQDLQILTKEGKDAAYVIFNRMLGTVIEKYGEKRGIYRTINKEVRKTKFIKDKIVDFPIILPFDLNTYCKLYPKSIMVVAGSKGSGKTALALKIALDNQARLPVVYLHSEGGDEEFSDRMQNNGIYDENQIQFEPIPCSVNFHDNITDEKKIFIIDYLEVHNNFYEVAIPIKKIHDKLKDGLAIIFIQKKAGALYGRGDEFSQEASRLYLSMDFLPEEQCTKVTIVNAKAPKGDENLSGRFHKIKITKKGTKISPLSEEWRNVWKKPSFEKAPDKPKGKYEHWNDK